jgi:hypothetical protein
LAETGVAVATVASGVSARNRSAALIPVQRTSTVVGAVRMTSTGWPVCASTGAASAMAASAVRLVSVRKRIMAVFPVATS